MNLKHVAVASLLAATSAAAFAGDQTVVLDLNKHINYFDASVETSGLLSDGSDVITFVGATPGKYNVTISISGQGVEFNGDATTLNGKIADDFDSLYTKKWSFIGLESTVNSPFVLDLAGVVKNAAVAGYSGEITITSAVPEPATYGMLLGGLGIMGFLARRKSKQA
jgi:PEP-CTERM motif